MPKILMTARKPHIYGNKRRQLGDQYEAAGETHARLMEALGNAVRATHPVPAAPDADPTPAPGTYMRRDLVAEGTPSAPARKVAAKKSSKSFLRRRSDNNEAAE